MGYLYAGNRFYRSNQSHLRRGHVVYHVSAALTVALSNTAAFPNRYRDNPDRVIDQRVERWTSPIGRLETGRRVSGDGIQGIFRGTGFLISPCYIMTAAHVVSPDSDALLSGEIDPHIDFRMIFRARDTSSYAIVNLIAEIDRDLNEQKVRYLKSSDLSTGRPSRTDVKDYIFLKLSENECAGASPGFGWFETAENDMVNGELATGLGYPKSRNKGEIHLGTGRLGDVTAAGLREFSGSYKEGESGGPLLVVEHGRLKVAGIIVAHEGSNNAQEYETFSHENTNEVLSLVPILNYPPIKAIIAADKARFGNRNPAVNRQMTNGILR